MPDSKVNEFHAVMEQPEPGLFRATYRADFNPDIASRARLYVGQSPAHPGGTLQRSRSLATEDVSRRRKDFF
jgi:hypothetical protein